MDIIKKLNVLRLERDLSVYRLAELSGINQSTLANTFSRGTIPSITTLEALCEAMGITLAQFFTDKEEAVCLTADELNLIEGYRKLSSQEKQAVSAMINTFSKRQ